MPSVQRVHNDFKDKGVVVLAISIDSSRAPVETYLAEGNYTMPVVLDANIEIASKFAVLGTPTTFSLSIGRETLLPVASVRLTSTVRTSASISKS